jgi:predicted RNA methylase
MTQPAIEQNTNFMTYAQKIEALENEGLSTSDAQAVVDAEEMKTARNPFSATYSPDDNKLRISCTRRIDADTFARLKAAGYKWAPKQEQMIAPMWTPGRYDLALELAGEVLDDDTTLADRAEERAERFETYSDKRAQDGDRAHSAAQATGERFAMGQPILIGHHSEKKARKDAARIESSMKKAVDMWETSEYWKRRAEGALHHAKYKELPEVRARRIKKIEAEKRGVERDKMQAEKCLAFWSQDGITHEAALAFVNYNGFYMPRKEGDKPDFNQNPSAYNCLTNDYPTLYAPRTLEEITEAARRLYPRSIARANRWIEHYNNRLSYEIAMLNEQGKGELIAKKPRPTQLPLVNYKQDQFVIANRWNRGAFDTLKQIELTSEQYKKVHEDQKGTRTIDNSHRIRIARVEFNEAGEIKRFASYNAPTVAVFLTDSKTHPKPAAIEPTPPTPPAPRPEYKPYVKSETEQKIAAVQQSLDLGVQVAVAPQLFPTPADLAARVIEAADIRPGDSVLEPSAGTGALIEAVDAMGLAGYCKAVEISRPLADGLAARFKGWTVNSGNFLDMQPDALDCFDKIVMNPPFANQQDIDHVIHALGFLKEGGKLVAIISAGVEFRQDKKAQGFRELVERMGGTIERLPDDSFKQSGTGVNTVLVEVCK